jgi:hypothetical protein
MSNISQRADLTDPERARAATTFNGSYLNIGTALTDNPVMIIFDNQTDVDVPLSVTGNSTWKTFSPGEAIILDMRANHGIASNFTIDAGTQFSTNASVGTSGSFRISVINTR